MEFLTIEATKQRVAHTLGRSGFPVMGGPGYEVRRLLFGDAPGSKYFLRAREILLSLGHFEWCLLWVVRTDSRPTMENLHLYYRLRNSYGDRSMVHDRPALLASRNETADLMSFLHLGLLSEWEMYLVTSHDHGRAFVSSAGYVDLCTKNAAETCEGEQAEVSGEHEE